MKITKQRAAMSALAAAATLAAFGAQASLVYLAEETALFHGTGLGAVNTVLTLQKQGNNTTESGSVIANGAGFSTTGDAGTGASQSSLRTLGSLGVTDTSDLRIVFNATEPGGNSITVSSLSLTFYDALNTAAAVFNLVAPVTFEATNTGIGKSGFVFGLDAAQAALAATFIGGSSTSFADFRIGLGSTLTNVAGGPETFYAVNAGGVTTPVPEPETYALLLAGLGVVGFVARRRRPQGQP